MLDQALRSLRQQSRTPKIIVVNNGESAEVAEVVQGYPEVRQVWVEACTLYKAANAGIRQARTPYIVRLDADDWIDPHLIEEEEDCLDASDASCVWPDYWEARDVSHGIFTLEHRAQDELELSCGAMYCKSCWQAIGGYDEKLHHGDSVDFWHRFQAKFRTVRLPKPLYYYRKGHASMSTEPEREQAIERLNALYRR